ncbi:MAG: glutamate 5-kinase, partial [Desulfovibrio sp.]|nr:glutamate 5-kinase [Desulfovibrio sp.]
DDLRSRRRFQFATSTFLQMLAWDLLPIVNENDTVSTSELKFGDNDSLASLLVNLAEADLFVNLTSAKGVMDKDPASHPDAKILERIDDIAKLDIDAISGEKTELGSGGMRSKLLAARRVAQLGTPTLILPGRERRVLEKAFSGDFPSMGTWVAPQAQAIPRRKFWLAYQSDPAGVAEIDDGAAEALLHKGTSLLPGGVKSVYGDFEKGALLRVVHNGQTLGAGFSNYSSDDLRKIRGLKRHEIAAILGIAKYPDVIHRDNLLLDAAL